MMKPTLRSLFGNAYSLPWLCLFLGFLLLLIWSFVCVDLYRIREQTMRFSRAQTDTLARHYAAEVSEAIGSIDNVLRDLRDQWKDNPDEFGAEVGRRQRYFDPGIGLEVAVVNASGKLVFSSLLGKNAKAIDLSDREYFITRRDNPIDELFISEPLLTRTSHSHSVLFVRPLHTAQSEFNGVIVLFVSPTYFSGLHHAVDLGLDGSVAVLRMDGGILTYSPDLDLALGKSIKEASFLSQPANRVGAAQLKFRFDQVERLYSWRVIPKTGLAVMLGQSTKTLFKQYDRQRKSHLVSGTIGSIGIFLIGCIMFMYLRRLTASRDALEGMRESLQHSQKLEAVGRLTGGVAHDFNNILQVISSNIQILQLAHSGNESTERRLASALNAVNRGAKLSCQLLTFARRQPLKTRAIDIEKRIEYIDDLLKGAVGAGIEIDLRIPDHLWNTAVDPDFLENAILNLAINARDAMNGRGTLTIQLSNAVIDHHRASAHPGITPGEYVLLTMTDTGSGMTPEVMKRVFEPFFTTKQEGAGTGLGLSMVYGFVKQSGGHIEIASETDCGTTVSIFLSRCAEAETNTSPRLSRAPSGGTETILLVEDDMEVQSAVSATLTQLGYDVLKADRADSALAILEQNESISVLFTDVVMAGDMDGLALAKKSKSIRPALAILLASGYLYDAIKNQGELDESMLLLKKPYTREQLDAAIRQLLAANARTRFG